MFSTKEDDLECVGVRLYGGALRYSGRTNSLSRPRAHSLGIERHRAVCAVAEGKNLVGDRDYQELALWVGGWGGWVGLPTEP